MSSTPSSFQPLETPKSFAPLEAPESFQLEGAPSSFQPETDPTKPWLVPKLKDFSPDAAITRGALNAKAGLFNSISRGQEAWMEFTKRPTVQTIMSVVDPVGKFITESARLRGTQDVFAKEAEAWKAKMISAPEASIESVIDKPSMTTIGNWTSYQLGSLPFQVGPGILSGLAGAAVGGRIGAAITSFPTSFVQNMGGLYENLLEKGVSKEDAAMYAQAGGLGMALLDTAVPTWLAGKVMNKFRTQLVDRAMTEVVKKGALRKTLDVAKTTALGTLSEGTTEAMQEMISSGVESGVTGERFLTPENTMRWLDNFMAGAFMGGVVGGAAEAIPQAKFRGKTIEDFRQDDAKRQAAVAQAQLIDPAVDPAPIIEQARQEEFVETDASRQFWQEQEQRDLDATRLMLMEEEEITRAEEEAGRTLLPREPQAEAQMPMSWEPEVEAKPTALAMPPLLEQTFRGTHKSSNVESLAQGIEQRDLGFSVARTPKEEVSSPTLKDRAGKPGVVAVTVAGKGLDYTVPEHKQYIDSVLEYYIEHPEARSPLANGEPGGADTSTIRFLRDRGVSWVNGWNGIGASPELHVLDVRNAALAPAEPAVSLPSIHDIINQRNVEYHATDLEGMKGILESEKIGLPRAPSEEGYLVSFIEQGKKVQDWIDLDTFHDAKLQAEKLVEQHPGATITFGNAAKLLAAPSEVSTSRIARIASKADKAITFVLDAEKMPARKPIAESGYAKTTPTYNAPANILTTWELEDYEIVKEKHANQTANQYEEERLDNYLKKIRTLVPNKHFEFEHRTKGEPIPLSAVKAILVDRSALEQEERTVSGWKVISPNGESNFFADQDFSDSADTAATYAKSIPGAVVEASGAFKVDINTRISEIQSLASAKGIPVRVYESGKEMHTSRARMQLELTGLKVSEISARLKQRIMQYKTTDFFRDDIGEIDYNVFSDLVELGVAKLQQGALQFEAWSQEMLKELGEAVRPILQSVYDAAKIAHERAKKGLDPVLPSPDVAAAERALAALDAPSEDWRLNIRADLDQFSWASKKFLHVLQWYQRNPHNIFLESYLKVLRKLVYFGDKWRSIAFDTIQAGKKLSGKQTEALANMLFDMTLWSHKITRPITEEERVAKRIEVARQHGVDERGMEMYGRIHWDFLEALHEEEVAEAERIERTFAREIPTPEKLAAKNAALMESAEKFARHRNKEFFPTTRFGKLAVIVKANGRQTIDGVTYADGELVEFQLFEHEKSLGLPTNWRPNLADGLADARKHYPADKFYVYDWQLPEGVDTHLAYPSALYQAIETNLALNEEQRSDLRQMIIKSSPAQAFIQHWGRRRGTKGFSRDIWRAYAAYFTGFANHISRLKYRDELEATLLAHKRTVTEAGKQTGSARKRQQIQDALQTHFDDVMHPRNYVPKLRAAAFQLYFFMMPKQAAINLTQIPVFLYPYLAGQLVRDGVANGIADGQAVAAITKACYVAARMYQGKLVGLGGAAVGGIVGGAVAGPMGVGIGANVGGALSTRATKQGTFEMPTGDSQIARLLKWGHETGLLDQGYATAMGSIAGTSAAAPLAPVANLVRDVADSGTQLFRASEQYNRLVTILATYYLAQQRGLSEEATKDFAQDAIHRTMFAHEAWARPEIMRGKLSVATIFKTYLQNALFAMFQNPGKMRSWLVMGILGGLTGVPFGDDLLKLLDASGSYIKKAFFKDLDPRTDTEKSIRDLLIALNADPNLLVNGLSGTSFGLPYLERMFDIEIPSMDFSNSLSMGRIVPMLDPALKAAQGMLSGPDFVYRSAQEAMGVVGTMGNGMLKTAFNKDDKALMFARLLLPQFARQSMMAYEAQTAKKVTDNRGNEVVKFDLNNKEHQAEIAAMGFGVAPQRLAKMRDADYTLYERALYYTALRSALVNSVVNAQLRGETGELEIKHLVRVNNTLPADVKITKDSITTAVKERLKDRVMDALGMPDKAKEIEAYESIKRAYGVH